MNTKIDFSHGETALLTYQEWDTRMLERSCGSIAEMSEIPANLIFPAGHYLPLIAEINNQKLEYVTARRPLREANRIEALKAVGFAEVDRIVEFSRKLGKLPEVPAIAEYQTRLAGKEDAQAVGDLSARTFTLSRFHNDPLISAEQADRVHREWGKNSCLGTAAQAVWILEREGRLAGFITCSIKGSAGTIGLIAVDAAHAGRGLGPFLVYQACRWFGEQNCTAVRVLTQANNDSAMKLYAKTGFERASTMITLRWAKENK